VDFAAGIADEKKYGSSTGALDTANCSGTMFISTSESIVFPGEVTAT
jgi:hypothetical protein